MQDNISFEFIVGLLCTILRKRFVPSCVPRMLSYVMDLSFFHDLVIICVRPNVPCFSLALFPIPLIMMGSDVISCLYAFILCIEFR